MIRTYIDAGVLIAAAREPGKASALALAILDDPQRAFASSIFVQLEVLPKAIFNKRNAEVHFYSRFFNAVQYWADPASACSLALEIASESGLNALDALHVAATVVEKADEIVTTERPAKPLHRTRRVKIVPME